MEIKKTEELLRMAPADQIKYIISCHSAYQYQSLVKIGAYNNFKPTTPQAAN